jgi:hypothetical protein
MSVFAERNPIMGANDAVLVMSSLRGDRNTFCEIVTRHQNLLCSLAYSVVGDKPALGWISGGNQAYRLLFSWGSVAVAPISVGIVSIGMVIVGTLGFGAVDIGVIGFGASAIAYKAYASLSALGWESAFSNGFSITKETAIGPIAQVAQVQHRKTSTSS